MDNLENKDQPIVGPKSVDEKIVETFADDMARVIEDDKDGLIKKIIHQDEEHQEEKRNQSPEAKKNQIFVVVGMVLFASTLAILAMTISRQIPKTVAIQAQFAPLIFTDKSISIEIDGMEKDRILEAISGQIKKAVLKNGELEAIYLTENKKTIGLKRFIELTRSDYVFPVSIAAGETVVSDNFLLGLVNNGQSNEFFMLIKTKSMNDIFSSLRNWEDKIFTNLYKLFGFELSSDTEYLLTKNFTDGVMGNKNARILYDKDGGISAMYVFVNDSSVVMTRDGSTARELISRLGSSKIRQ